MKQEASAEAAFVTARNAHTLVGETWSWCLRQAVTLGVPVFKRGKKRLIPFAAFVAALEANPIEQPANDIDPAELLRQRLGRRLL